MENDRLKWGTLISCSISCFVGFLDYAIVNTALPAIQESLSASVLELEWVMNAFILMMVVFLASTGRIADLLGRRYINILGLILFFFASLLCSLAWNPAVLIFGRMVQGIAIAAVFPSSVALIHNAFPAEEKGKALGIWSSITGIGLALGPVVGGILVSALNWRWIFYINLPLAALSIALNYLFVKESKDAHAIKKIDPKGFLLLTIGTASLVTAFMHLLDWGWDSPKTLSLFAVALIGLSWFYFSERKCPYPIIPFESFAHPIFLFSSAVVFSWNFFTVPALFFIPLYLQTIRHETPYLSGLALLPITGMVALLSPIVGKMLSNISAKWLILCGFFLYLISAAMQAFFRADSSLYWILTSVFLIGVAWPLLRIPATTRGVAALPPHLSGTAAGVLWTVQNIGAAVGLAITGSVFRAYYENTAPTFMSGYRAAMWLLAAVSLLSFLYTATRKEKFT
jgi:EmrB/QacA subfamily drug resistance transporter